MTKRAIIRVGDPTSHGGTVLEAFPTLEIYGKNAVGVGHRGFCPLCRRDFVVVAGVENFSYFGKSVAVDGMHTSCGAVLIATQGQATIDDLPAGAGALPARTLAEVSLGRPAFDERIRFFLSDRTAVANTPYKLILADGSTVTGRTDVAGQTERIKTDSAQAINCVEFYPDTFHGCACAVDHLCETGGRGAAPALTVELQGIETNSHDLGSSIVDHTLPKADHRLMTEGEIAMARTVFKDAIDYNMVRIHNGGLFGQPNRTNNAMTPRGEIYFPAKYYQADFSKEEKDIQVWFIHEMGHVWQYQLGYSVVWAGIRLGVKGGYSDDGVKNQPSPAYRYSLEGEDKNRAFPEFNMEQQAQLLAHWFGATQLSIPAYIFRLSALQRVLGDFLQNPRNPALLPITTNFESAP